MGVEKVNVTLPKETLLKLRRFVPAGERSQVIAQATNQYLEGLIQKSILRKVSGLWRDRTSLRTQTDVNRALKKIRGSTESRLKGLGKGG